MFVAKHRHTAACYLSDHPFIVSARKWVFGQFSDSSAAAATDNDNPSHCFLLSVNSSFSLNALHDMPRNHNLGTSALRNRNRVTNKTRLKVVHGNIDADALSFDEDEEKARIVSTAGVDAEDANVSPLCARRALRRPC